MDQTNIEAMSELMEQRGIIATIDQIERLVEAYDSHVMVTNEPQIDTKPVEECKNCKILEKENDLYIESLKKELSIDRVSICHGKVKFENRPR